MTNQNTQERLKHWASILNCRQYRDEVTQEEREQMKAEGIIVVYGASDDLMELDGAIYDEYGVYDGGTYYWDGKAFVPEDDDEKDVSDLTLFIKAAWGHADYSFFMETNMPHEVFDILEDDEKYCRGVVFHKDSLATYKTKDEQLEIAIKALTHLSDRKKFEGRMWSEMVDEITDFAGAALKEMGVRK